VIFIKYIYILMLEIQNIDLYMEYVSTHNKRDQLAHLLKRGSPVVCRSLSGQHSPDVVRSVMPTLFT
jgi:hypothetical protein